MQTAVGCCVISTNDLMGQPYNMLEYRQDMYLKLNAWKNYDILVTIKNDENVVEEMLQGFFNFFELFRKEVKL